jgi:hypothetical protein
MLTLSLGATVPVAPVLCAEFAFGIVVGVLAYTIIVPVSTATAQIH